MLGITDDPRDGDKLSVSRSTDGGASWQVVKRFVARLNQAPVVVDPAGGSVVAVCNWEPRGTLLRRHGGQGVFVSRDGGMTWKKRLQEPCNSVAIQPGGRVLLASTTVGMVHEHLWRSTDGGARWHRVSVTMRHSPGSHPRGLRSYRRLVFDPRRPRIVVAAEIGGDNIFRSIDAGRTWKHVWSAFTGPGQRHRTWAAWSLVSISWSAGRFVIGPYLRSGRKGRQRPPVRELSSVDHGRTWRMTISCGGKTWKSVQPCDFLQSPPLPVRAGSAIISAAKTDQTALLELPRSATRWRVVPVSITP